MINTLAIIGQSKEDWRHFYVGTRSTTTALFKTKKSLIHSITHTHVHARTHTMCTNKNSTVLRQDKKDSIITPLLIILISHNQKANKRDGLQTLGNKTLLFFFFFFKPSGRPLSVGLCPSLPSQPSRGSMNP